MQQIEAVYWSISYGIASLAFLSLALLLVAGPKRSSSNSLLSIAAGITAIWAAIFAGSELYYDLSLLQVLLLELSNDAGWVIFLSATLSGAIGRGPRYWFVRYGGTVLIIGMAAIGIALETRAPGPGSNPASGGVLIAGSILTSLFALVAIEQIFRNAREGQRAGLKYLVLGVGGIFVYDLVLYSDAIFAGRINEGLWVARGLATALCVPLIGLAAKRSSSSPVGLFVSRHVVFHTATVFGAGVYLTVIGFIGSYLRETGANWSVPVLGVTVFAAVLVMLVLLVSERVRARIRVFIAKHFFENKYDYRLQWLGLIHTLTSGDSSLPLKKRGIKALAQILDVKAGSLWVRDESGGYLCAAGWNCNIDSISSPAEDALVRFLQDKGWVIDLEQLALDPAGYNGLVLKSASLGVDESRYVIPLFHDQQLLGFVVLSGGVGQGALNFEDHDLLKTAGRQIAGLLAQEIATEQLSEVRQFEAFNKLTAYLMHDLKNVIAQQVLLVDNAEKHKTNPKFIDDAIDTIRGGVRRMRSIIDHLQQRSPGLNLQKVETGKIVMRAASDCEDRLPLPTLDLGCEQIWINADPDKLQMGIYHAIRNAQDATGTGDSIDVQLTTSQGACRIEVIDTGTGMTPEFVRERLFRPFDSTKGTQGMGMGAFQLRETVTGLGGRVNIESVPGRGTRVTVEIPLAS